MVVCILEQRQWLRAIQRNVSQVFQDLDSDDVITFLLQEGAITTEDFEKIENEPGSNKKVYFIYKQLWLSLCSWYYFSFLQTRTLIICLFQKQRYSWTTAFLQALSDKDHLKHLAEQIKEVKEKYLITPGKTVLKTAIILEKFFIVYWTECTCRCMYMYGDVVVCQGRPVRGGPGGHVPPP